MPKFIIIPGLLILLAGFFQPAKASPVWTITPDAYVQQQYTDNLFQDRDNRKSEWITVIGAGLELEAQDATQGMTLGYRPSYSMYHKYDEFNTLRHYADLELWKNIREHLRLSFINSFEYREQPYDPDDPDYEFYEFFLDDDDLRRGREPRTINTARARMDYRFGPRNTAYLQYLQRNEWNDNPGEEDNQRYSPSAGMTYWFNVLYGIEAAASYTHGRFDTSENRNIWDGRVRLMRNFTRFLDGYVQYRHNHVRYSGDRPGYTVYEPSVGIAWRFDEEGRMSLGVGYYVRDEQDNGREESLVLNADINKTWSQRRSSFTLRGSSGYEETFTGTGEQGFTVYYLGRAGYTYALTRDLDWDLYAGYRRNVYKDRDPERRDNVYDLGTGLSYMLTRQINVGLNYDYRRVDSNIRVEEYYENRGTLTLNWRPQPKRLN
jgi:hypothetical protein